MTTAASTPKCCSLLFSGNTVFGSNISSRRLAAPQHAVAAAAAQHHRHQTRRGEDVTGAAPSITAPRNKRRYRHLSRSANLMSSEASLFAYTRSHGSLVVEAHASSSGAECPAPATCPPQLSEEAIASIPLELPPLDESRMSAAAVSAAASLRLNYAISSSHVQSGILSLRKAWLQWHLLHMMPAGIRCAGLR